MKKCEEVPLLQIVNSAGYLTKHFQSWQQGLVFTDFFAFGTG
jgi:hypothetical protein